MINLIHNSIKFSKHGDVVNVSISNFEVTDPQNYLGINIKVTDWGIGIAEEDRKNLFTVFYKS